MSNLKNSIAKQVQILEQSITLENPLVVVTQAGSPRKGKVVQIKADRSKAQVKFAQGLPLWYGAEHVHPVQATEQRATKKDAAIAKPAKDKASVKSAKKAATPSAAEKAAKTIVKAGKAAQQAVKKSKLEKAVEQEQQKAQARKVQMTAKQLEMFTLLKKSKQMSARQIADAMTLTKLEVIKIGVHLLENGYLAGKLEQGESSYTISARGKKLQLGDIEIPVVKSARGTKTQQVVELISAGANNKHIALTVGCDASHISHIRSMLFIREQNAKPENAKLTNEEFSKKVGKTMYLVNLFRK
jgi:hypothetical protein